MSLFHFIYIHICYICHGEISKFRTKRLDFLDLTEVPPSGLFSIVSYKLIKLLPSTFNPICE